MARRFPVRVGRASNSDLRLEEEGVWDHHMVLAIESAEGCVLTSDAGAVTSVNGEPVQRAVLHNGDSIQAGAAQLRFWLSEARQGSLGAREVLTWALIVGIFAAQAALLYWLLK